MTVYSLSTHADYACRHSGACCTGGWHIPVEPRLRNLLRTDVLVPGVDGVCEYFDRPSRLCRIHRDHGEASLPASCHHFPRRALMDDRGIFVTLSHFCPTAARLLCETKVPLAIVAEPPAFPPTREYDGLDARGEWPPLVRADVLFDMDSYSRWEEFIVSTFARHGSVQRALAVIAAAAEQLRLWRNDCGSFSAWTDRVVTGDIASNLAFDTWHGAYASFAEVTAYEAVTALVLDGLPAPKLLPEADTLIARYVTPAWDRCAPAVRRYLAAKAFGSWSTYQARGVRTLVAELVVSEIVLRVECARTSAKAGRPLDRDLLIEAFRASDLLLVHLIDRARFVRWLGRVEGLPFPLLLP